MQCQFFSVTPQVRRRNSGVLVDRHGLFRHYLNMDVITCIKNTVHCHFTDSDHLPLCQTPSLKRIYTKAHSLNLHLLDLHPESRGMAIKRRGEEREREDSSDRTAQDKHTKPRKLKSLWVKFYPVTELNQ